ncbi:hypothetical protein F7725_025445 [Dissostichus mawsoni]|uniref:Uncharacterized protein n=1 Tax=Dissostichus mawsoni TaxID=36200 RepID=A0A7J5XBD8_DISMA|nr:hypothetical protein F7725_025445 [Dissostichus mawsoni]
MKANLAIKERGRASNRSSWVFGMLGIRNDRRRDFLKIEKVIITRLSTIKNFWLTPYRCTYTKRREILGYLQGNYLET